MPSFGPVWHYPLDLLACLLALLIGLWQKSCVGFADNPHLSGPYIFTLLIGCVLGGYGLGTLNLTLSGIPHLAHSVLGALAGAILAVETYKALRGIHLSTGAAYVLPFCLAVAVGRIGCFLCGLADQTYGVPTQLPWAIDFGDGINRHPVQLYEAVLMAIAFFGFLIWLKATPKHYSLYAFPTMVGLYAFQRFLWEFLKPYVSVWWSLNLFQLVCLILMLYSLLIIFHRLRRAQLWLNP